MTSPTTTNSPIPTWQPALAGLAERILGPIAGRITFAGLADPDQSPDVRPAGTDRVTVGEVGIDRAGLDSIGVDSPATARTVVRPTATTTASSRRYAYAAAGNHLVIEATDATSAAVGLHQYLREQCGIAVSWDDLRPPSPTHFIDAARTEGAARVQEVYYLNFCTFGYTSPWWDWEQWEREIDWMALRGITAPLMMVGHEAVLERVLLGEGLDQGRVQRFLAGPAYLPWLAMGNLEGHAGPPPTGWIAAHRELAGKILARQRELGMRPVLPAFTGHVPAELTAGAGARDWQGHRTHVVSPDDPAFRRIAAAMVRAQQEFWGTDHRYASDPFIEMIPVESDPQYPGRVAAALLAGLTDADPNASWFLQTWPFSYQKEFWTQERVRTFLEAIDPRRLVLLDLWAEAHPQWRLFDGFGDREWMWCALLNFGGRNEPLADLPGATEKLDAALDSPNPPTGAGLSMEATRAAPVYFERLLDATWQRPPALRQWLTNWAAQRYRLADSPLADHAGTAWHGLARTVLASGDYLIFPEAFTGLLTQRPSADPFAQGGELTQQVAAMLWYDPTVLIDAWRSLVELAEELPDRVDGPLGRDLVEAALGVLPRFGELSFLAAYDQTGVRDQAAAAHFWGVFDDLEVLLATRAEFRYDQWEADALRWASEPEDSRLLVDNARRLVTVWGHSGDGYLDDYSARYWAGMMGYYHQRWRHWAALHPVGTGTAQQLEDGLLELERTFLREGPPSLPAPASVVDVSRRLVDTYGPLFIDAADRLRSTYELQDGAR